MKKWLIAFWRDVRGGMQLGLGLWIGIDPASGTMVGGGGSGTYSILTEAGIEIFTEASVAIDKEN